MKFQFSPPIASITVDCVIFGFQDKKLHILLIKRSSEPELGKWALPGGFLEKNETLDTAANRILEVLTGIKNVYLEQTKAFSEVNRHPMGRVITMGYFALINPENFELKADLHASEVQWLSIEELDKLPFDHQEIFESAIKILRREIKLRPIGFELLPQKFTMTELQQLYEAIINKKLDRRNFSRKIKNLDFLIELPEKRKGAHVSANLYQFDQSKYNQLVQEGFLFNI